MGVKATSENIKALIHKVLQYDSRLWNKDKTAWYMIQKIRECYDFDIKHGGIVEIDLIYF